jgi:hypothetical protein
MSNRGNCDLCERESELADGVCAPCRARYHIAPAITPDRMLAVLSQHIGASNGVTIAELVTQMLHPTAIDPRERPSIERSARELVVQLRLAGHHVCSHPSSGYYMAATPEELDAACNFLYDRAMTSLTQVAAMRRVSLPDLRGQLQLPT